MKPKYRAPTSLYVVALATALWGFSACDGGADATGSAGGTDSQTGDPTADGSAPTNTGDGTTTPVDGNTPAASCDATATATLTTDRGDLTYANAAVVATAKHMANNGCVNELSIALSQDGGCALSVTLQSSSGAWIVSTGSLTVDASCGAGISSEAYGSYTLDPVLSTGGLDGLPSAVDMAAASCVQGTNLDMTGLLLFTGENKTLEVNLNGVVLNGDVLSNPVTSGDCPAELAACTDRTCGTDDYGRACGTCAEGEGCLDGGCVIWNCPPEGPFGTTPGKNLTNAELHDCDGNTVWLHELCGADAAFFNLLAGW